MGRFFASARTIFRPIVPQTYDCIVVGAGAIGLGLAYELSTHGMQVAVVDHAQLSHQASWAAAGIIPPADLNQAHDAWQQMIALGHQLHADWAARLQEATGIDVGYRQCGAIHFACTAGEAAALRAASHQWRDDGVRCTPLDAAGLREIQPEFSSEIASRDAFYAVWLPAEAQVRPPRFLRALRAACQQQGVQFFADAEADRFRMDGMRAAALATSQGEFMAGTYCVTAGAWTARLLETLGVSLQMRPWRGQMVLLANVDPGVNMILNQGPNYLVPRADGRVLVGSTVEDVGFQIGTTREAIERLIRFAKYVMPSVRFEVEAEWSALRPGTGDGFPFIGSVPGTSNVFAAAGHFRSGIALCPATARLLRQHVLGQPSSVQIDSFRLDRE